MKVIATNIFDFTTWYKFGLKTVPKSLIIDLEDVNLSGEELLQKTGFFEEEYEAFYIEVKDDVLNDEKELIDVSLYDASYIIPISETGSRLLQNKIPDFKLFAPLEDETYNKLMTARNNALAMQGAKRLLAAFNVEWKQEYESLQNSFLQSLAKYKANLNAEQETVLDQVLFYERSKPYPLTDHGFLFDVGSIVRSRFNIQDEDIKSKDVLKENDPYKYEVVEQIISLSKFLTNKEVVGVWSEFVKYYEDTPQLKVLNEELFLSNELKSINNLLIIGLYLKFRDMIRNTRTLEEKPFTDYIQKSLSKVPEEAKLALLLNGLFFGGLKFKELHYKFVPLHIAKLRYIKPEAASPPPASLPITSPVDKEVAVKKDDVPLIDGKPEVKENDGVNNNPELFKSEFDHDLWSRLEPLMKKYNVKQREKIKKSFEVVKNFDKGKMFTGEVNFFINILKKEVSSKRGKEENRITKEIVNELENEINKHLQITETT